MSSQIRPLKGAWGMTALLLLFMLINFADKVVVGLAAPPIMAELKLTPEQFGLLGSSFFFLFAVSGVVVGFITNRSRPATPSGHGDHLVARAVPHAGHGHAGDADRLPHHPGRGRRAGRAGGAALHLQVVSRSAARRADRDHRPGLGARRHRRRADAQLDHRQPFLALGVRRARRRRPPGVLWPDFRPRRHAGRPAGGAEGMGGERVPYRRLLTCPSIVATCCAASPATGGWRWPHLVHLLPGRRPGL